MTKILQQNEAAGSEIDALTRNLRLTLARLEDLLSAPETFSTDRPLCPSAHGKLVRAYLRARRLREKLLPCNLFADPAWDILLDLYAAGAEGRTVSISSACIASAVPSTTALRWLAKLEDSKLIERTHDGADARRIFVRLTDKARSGVGEWVGACLWSRETRAAPRVT